MISLDRDLGHAAELQEPRRIDALEREPDKLHRADFFVRHLALVESGRDLFRTDFQPQMTFEPDQPGQRGVAFLRVRIFDQQRRNQFARARNQLVVGVDFVLDRFAVRRFLRPDHFLDLVPLGLRVFENERQMRSDVQPAPLLLMDEQRPQSASHAFVVG